MSTFSFSSRLSASTALRFALWAAQFLIFVSFTTFGVMKLVCPISVLAGSWHWPGELPHWLVRVMGLVDLAGGVGIFLPAATRVHPRMSVLAALGCTVLQICAIVFHVSRGEAAATPLNIVLLAFSAFILWGRSIKAPIAPRW